MGRFIRVLIHVFLVVCPDGSTETWIMNDQLAVPTDLISIEDPGNSNVDKEHARSDNNMITFKRAQEDSNKPSIIVDIDQEDHSHSYANVYAVKVNNLNLKMLRIYKKETDDDANWVQVDAYEIPNYTNGIIQFDEPIQMGMIKVEARNNVANSRQEDYIFNIDIAVCGFGYGMY